MRNLHIPSRSPAYAQNAEDSIKWFKWGWKNDYIVFSWPTLPRELVNKNSKSFEFFNKIICFSTHNKFSEETFKVHNKNHFMFLSFACSFVVFLRCD